MVCCDGRPTDGLPLPVFASDGGYRANIAVADGLPSSISANHVLIKRVELLLKDPLGHWLKADLVCYDAHLGSVTIREPRLKRRSSSVTGSGASNGRVRSATRT